MDKRIFLLMLVMLLLSPPILYAQETELSSSQFEARLSRVKNPFKSQLPVKEVKKVEQKPLVKPPPRVPDIKPTPKKPIAPKQQAKTPSPTMPRLTISGIIWNSRRPQAIINGKIIDIGDTISNVKITDIQKSGVHGLFNGELVTIKPQRSQL